MACALTLAAFLIVPDVVQASQSAQTQNPAPAQIDGAVMQHAMTISKTCPGAWTQAACLKALSSSNHDLAVNYAQSVQNAGKTEAVEAIKQSCAASTAATQQDYPAKAMQSAFTECANGIYDISQKTGVNPDPTSYQLLVGSILCLSGAPQCAALEQQMRAMVAQ